MSEIYDNVQLLMTQMATLYPQTLTENTDLNSLDVGTYIVPTEEIAATLLNKPSVVNSTAYVTVLSGGSDGQLIMIYYVCSKYYPAYYQRAFYQNAWGNWVTIDIVNTEWLDLPLANGIGKHNANTFPCRYRRIGKKVYVQGCVNGFSDVEKVVAILPSGYRPSTDFYSLQATQGGNVDTFNVRTNGEIKRMATTMPTSSLSNTNYHFINFEFLID